jgi:hypothetical protein
MTTSLTKRLHAPLARVPRPSRRAPFIPQALAAFCALTLAGCSPSIVVTLTPDGAAKASFKAEISATADRTAKRFTDSQGSVFDPLAIKSALSKAGFGVDSVETANSTGVSIAVSVREMDGLLEKAVSAPKGGRKFALTLSRESVAAALKLMPASAGDYVDLLMAPAFTGESLSAKEYESTIAAAYGKTLANELTASAFTLTVQCPSAVKAARIDAPGTASSSGTQAKFNVPLSSLLAMEKPIALSAEW